MPALFFFANLMALKCFVKPHIFKFECGNLNWIFINEVQFSLLMKKTLLCTFEAESHAMTFIIRQWWLLPLAKKRAQLCWCSLKDLMNALRRCCHQVSLEVSLQEEKSASIPISSLMSYSSFKLFLFIKNHNLITLKINILLTQFTKKCLFSTPNEFFRQMLFLPLKRKYKNL